MARYPAVAVLLVVVALAFGGGGAAASPGPDLGRNVIVFVPSAQTHSSGTTWEGGATPGVSIPIDQFYVAKPGDSASTINAALHSGRNLLLTPGVYYLDQG